MPPADLAVHMIAFKGHREAVKFLSETEDYISQLRRGRPEIVVHRSIVPTSADVALKLCVPADLILVSAHGPSFIPRKPFVPRIGDRNSDNRLDLCHFGRHTPGKIGARAGIVWDVCNAGRPEFREQLEPHLEHEITHVGVIGKVFYEDSEDIVRAFLGALLEPETPGVGSRRRCGRQGSDIASARAHVPWPRTSLMAISASNHETVCPGVIPLP